jgi:hypothetical protein
MKRLLRESWGATLLQQLKAETAAMLDCGTTDDARRGVEAFSRRSDKPHKERANGTDQRHL